MNPKKLTLLCVLLFIIIIGVIGYRVAGFGGLLFSFAFIGGLVFWLLTTYDVNVKSGHLIFPYLITIICFLIHVFEEYVFHIEYTLSSLAGTYVSQANFLFIAAFAAPIAWLSGAVMIIKGWLFGYFLLSTFLFGMMFGEMTHFIAPLFEGDNYHYSPGMYTAFLPISSAWWMFVRLRCSLQAVRLKKK